jgi:PAS domain S-box-containing protein
MWVRKEIWAVAASASMTLAALWCGVAITAAPTREMLMLAVIATGLQVTLGLLVARQLIGREAGESAAQASQARYRAIFDTAQDGIVSIDECGRIEAFNPGAERIFGFAAPEVLGRPIALLIPGNQGIGAPQPDGRPAAARRTQVQARRKDGGTVALELTIGGWVGADGRQRFTGILRDIDERLSNERKLCQAMEQATTANRTKSAFLANMSHELRTPLNAIIGFAEALDTRYFGPLTDKQQDYVRDIQTSGRHLLALIGDILDISRIETGRIDLSDEWIDLDRLVDACLQLAAPRAQTGGVGLSRRMGSPLPLLRADPVRLKQIVVNLLVNAVKFTPPGGRVTISVAKGADGGLVITIADTGIGMSPEELQVALQPFHQIDSPLSKRFEGSGLGLPLARSLAELHGGRLVLDSRKGLGTVATILLPAERLQPDAADAA